MRLAICRPRTPAEIIHSIKALEAIINRPYSANGDPKLRLLRRLASMLGKH